MKRAISILLLALPCFAQSQYVTMTTSNGVITFTNVSGQAIVGMVGTLHLKLQVPQKDGSVTIVDHTGSDMYDNFFDAEGWANGEPRDFDTKEKPDSPPQPYSETITYIQFADGTSWGDKTTAASMFSHRTMAQNTLTTLYNASGDETQFLTALNAKQTDHDMDNTYAWYRHTQQDAGTAAAIAQVKARYAVGLARINSGKF